MHRDGDLEAACRAYHQSLVELPPEPEIEGALDLSGGQQLAEEAVGVLGAQFDRELLQLADHPWIDADRAGSACADGEFGAHADVLRGQLQQVVTADDRHRWRRLVAIQQERHPARRSARLRLHGDVERRTQPEDKSAACRDVGREVHAPRRVELRPLIELLGERCRGVQHQARRVGRGVALPQEGPHAQVRVGSVESGTCRRLDVVERQRCAHHGHRVESRCTPAIYVGQKLIRVLKQGLDPVEADRRANEARLAQRPRGLDHPPVDDAQKRQQEVQPGQLLL